MKHLLLILSFYFITPLYTFAQVKIGDNPETINSNSLLELEATNKGILLPRVALVATNSISPLTAHVQGMLIYNTSTSGTGATAVTPGYYYNSGTEWLRFISSTDGAQDGDAWNVDGEDVTGIVSRTGNVGIGVIPNGNNLDIAQATRIGTHNTDHALYVTGNFEIASNGVEFMHTNGTQGIGFGYASIYAAGSDDNQNINLMPKGTGSVGIGIALPSRMLTIAGENPIRTTNMTSSTADQTGTIKSLTVNPAGDFGVRILSPSESKNLVYPNTNGGTGNIPANATSFSCYNSNWVAAVNLPSSSAATAAGWNFGEIMVIYRSSTSAVTVNTTNTNLSSGFVIPFGTSVGFSLGRDKWYKVF